MSLRGDSGRPAAVAGHMASQRPQFAQASNDSRSFQVKSRMVATPTAGMSAAPDSSTFCRLNGVGRSGRLWRSGSGKKTLRLDVTMWGSFVHGTTARTDDHSAKCVHHTTG